MSRPTLPELAVLGSIAAGSGALAFWGGHGWLDWLFLTVVVSALAVVVRQVVGSWRLAAVERRRAAELASKRPSEVALAAVIEERRRLSEDIAVCLRDALESVERDARTAMTLPDPVPVIRRIHQTAVEATSELRRQLGLLRDPDTRQGAPVPRSPSGEGMGRRAVAVGALTCLLAAAESVVYPLISGVPVSWASLLLTVLAASTIVARSSVPGLGALICGLVFLAAMVVGAPVRGGFWLLISAGSLLWTISSRERSDRVDYLGAAVLIVAGTLSTWTMDRQNTGVTIVLFAVATIGGLAVRWGRRLAGRSREHAQVRQDELRLAAQIAVAAERHTFARELHDVVSHAIGLVAVHSGAAEMAWIHDREAARRSLQIIGTTAATTRAEMNRLLPGDAASNRTTDDLDTLVERIRAAGTPIELTTDLEVGARIAPVVYRIVQESLTNVVRHAPGAAARVTVRDDGEHVTVDVVDDGRADQTPTRRGYGLVGLAERVAFAGGVLQTGRASDGHGFHVLASVPSRTGSPV